ncbi:DNA mismatch repair endonuclease MutL, partial [Candidatus Ruminimicrobiellum ovillum]|uniref:DNA mismatch repair endonuclease MutL n=1 Tax=Candidatus Ruminimicrobiellum ovillum TaxID=1947927 RepID=UPI003559E80C
ENSIDAGATKIEITVRNSGKSYICVNDNGSDMDKTDLQNCILRHATSKLPTDDLMNINYLGFRGEAIPSIASVSKMNITTNNGNEGWCLQLENGEIKKLTPASHTKGTKIEVSDLFYNVPARLNFLKTDRGEMSAIIDVVERIALCHPEKTFILNDTLKFYPTDSLSRICSVLGKDFKENAIKIDVNAHNLKISGYICRPTYTRGTSANQYIYVNGRSLKDKLLFGALKAAYMDTMEKGKFPSVCLWLNIPNSDIDVNVHPQKAEIRFKEQNLVRGVLISSIRKHLANAEITPNVIKINNIVKTPDTTNQNETKILDFNTQIQNLQNNFVMETTKEQIQTSFDNKILPLSVNKNTIATDNTFADYITYPLGTARGQIHNTYIISQTEDGIVIVDQHACHERLVYEKIKKQMAEGGIKRQLMLIPEIVELGEKKAYAILDIKDELADFGLIIEEFGPGAIVIRETPAILGDADLQGLIKQIAEDISDFEKAKILENKIAMIAKTYACHTSIRAGKTLTIEEMNLLLRQVEQSENAGECNHGRRAYVKIDLDDLAKLFDR